MANNENVLTAPITVAQIRELEQADRMADLVIEMGNGERMGAKGASVVFVLHNTFDGDYNYFVEFVNQP